MSTFNNRRTESTRLYLVPLERMPRRYSRTDGWRLLGGALLAIGTGLLAAWIAVELFIH